MTATIIRQSDEQVVNTLVSAGLGYSRVTALKDGGWVVTWRSLAQDGSGYGIYQQRYNPDGTPKDGEQRVNTYTNDHQQHSAITTLEDGGWVVTWQSGNQDGSADGIYQQRYNADGTPQGVEQQVNTHTTFFQNFPKVTALKDGGWVVTWTSWEQDDPLGSGIYQQRYNADGTTRDGERQVNTTAIEDQQKPAIVALSDGGWVVTWASNGQDGASYGIYQQRYNADGTPKDGEQQVNTYTTSRQSEANVTALADGGWVVTWESVGQDGSAEGIYQQRYNADGSTRGVEQRVNTYTGGAQGAASVTALADGGWLVTWHSVGQDGDSTGVYQQRYDAEGMPALGEQRVNTSTEGGQAVPSVTTLDDGGWLVTWTYAKADHTASAIYQKRFSFVSAFGEGKESGAGTEDNDLFRVRKGGLGSGDSLDAGEGIDTLAMIETGILNLSAPDKLAGVEIVQGSGGNDVIVTDAPRLAGLIYLHGGAGYDELRLKAGSYDLTGKFLSGIEAIVFSGADAITFNDRATALLARNATQDGVLVLQGDTFSTAERNQLHAQGIRHVTDADGVHVLEHATPSLSSATVTENVPAGSEIGDLSATDPNPGDSLSYMLIDDAGGRFALSGSKLVVANGILLDYEQATSHTIKVRVTDAGGLTTDRSFTIQVADAPIERVTGAAGADTIKGGKSGDVIKGQGGNDRIYGGSGNDLLYGGTGKDIFVFDTAPNKKTNLDRIVDFNVKDDTLLLDNAVFRKLGSGSPTTPKPLNAKYFTAGDKARDGNDYLIYDKNTGLLFYDADGSGSGRSVAFAHLKKGLALTYKDFFVI